MRIVPICHGGDRDSRIVISSNSRRAFFIERLSSEILVLGQSGLPSETSRDRPPQGRGLGFYAAATRL
jgi:hypothetical protein